MESPVRFIIIDDHPAMLEGLKSILEKDGDFICSGTACTVAAGRELIQAARYQILLTDIRFPDGSGFELTELSRRLKPDIPVLFMTMYVTFDYILKAFQTGAQGFLSKESAGSTLREGARKLLQGEKFLDSIALCELIETITKSSTTSFLSEDEPYHLLTDREKEIFKMIAQGSTIRSISLKLGIAPKTVSNHRQNILFKLRLSDDKDITEYAARLGIIVPKVPR